MKFRPLLVALAVAAALSTPLIAQAQCYNAAGAPIKCREDREKKQAGATATLVPSPTPVPSPTSTVPPVSNLGVGIPPAPDAPSAQGKDGEWHATEVEIMEPDADTEMPSTPTALTETRTS